MPDSKERTAGPHERLHDLLAARPAAHPGRQDRPAEAPPVGAFPRVLPAPTPPFAPGHRDGVPASTGAEADRVGARGVRSAEALARAAVEYREAYGDPVLRAAADDRGARERRRVRWAVPWRLAAMAGVAVLLVAGGVALRTTATRAGEPVELPVPVPRATGTTSTTGASEASAASVDATAASSGEVVVHVVGHVAAPGVVRLPVGARVTDAVEAAGGALAEADLSALNLARTLVDGEQVMVPAPGDVPTTVGAAAAPSDSRVDLNTADAGALDALPGIGPVLAQRIVDHRTAAPFGSVDDLDDVPGIGPALMAELRDLVRVQG